MTMMLENSNYKEAQKKTYNEYALTYGDGNFLYKNIFRNLLLLYFFTGFLANIENLVNINNVVLIILFLFVFFRKKSCNLFSPLILLYGGIAFISSINHLVWIPEAGFPDGFRTMPIVFLAMVCARSLTIPGLFQRATLANTIPLIFLIFIGMSVGDDGRYVSLFLDENVQGWVMAAAFAIGINEVWMARYSFHAIINFCVPILFMLIAAKRTFLIFFSLSILILIPKYLKKIKFGSKKFIYSIVLLILFITQVFPIMLDRQEMRFGESLAISSHLTSVINGEANEKSSQERMDFINLSFDVAHKNWLGYGNANFTYVVETYGDSNLKSASHPHSAIAQALISGGYVGLLLLIMIIIYIFRIGYSNPIMLIVTLWLMLTLFIDANLTDRFLWPLLAIAERELQIKSSRYA